MKAFRFPLNRVLHWRATQCELEEAALSRLTSRRVSLANAIEQIATSRKEAATEISTQTEVSSALFQTIPAFHVRIDQQKALLQLKAKELEREIEAQLRRTAEARRKKKLLETLRESRLSDWTALRNAEDEAAAADAWLARYASERYTTTNAEATSG